MEFYQLRQLIAFAECGNLSKAAETVHTSQSALSRSMKNLEAELDVPLFMRTKNSISLTETGILAAERAKNVVSAHDDMILSVREAERKQHNFSFGSIAPAPIWNLTPILSEIFPGKTVNSDLRESETELIQGLDDGTYNLIVLLRPIEKNTGGKAHYKNTPFISESLSVLLPSAHRLSNRTSLRLKELAGDGERAVLVLYNPQFFFLTKQPFGAAWF